MTAIEFLRMATEAERRLMSAREKLERCKCSVERITSSFGKEHVSGGGGVDAHEEAMIRLIEAKEQFSRLSLVYDETVDRIMAKLDQLADPINKDILVLIDIKHLSVTETSKITHFSRSQLYRRREAAI